MKITITKDKLQKIFTSALPNYTLNPKSPAEDLTKPSRELITQKFNEGVFDLLGMDEECFDETFKLVKFGKRRTYINHLNHCVYLNCCNKSINQWITYPSDKLCKDESIVRFEYILGEDYLCTKTLYYVPKHKPHMNHDVYLRIKDSKVIYNLSDISIYVNDKYLIDCPEVRQYSLNNVG